MTPATRRGAPHPPARRARIGLVSLGCPKNLVDSEAILGSLVEAGHEIVDDPSDADVLVVNTCCFVDAARRESENAIRRAVRWRGGRPRAGVVVAGCLPQREGASLVRRIPGADAYLGIDARKHIAAVVERLLAGAPEPALHVCGDADALVEPDEPRLRLTPPHLAYVKIAEGCDHPCAFCVIPRVRGRYRSRDPQSVETEVCRLVGEAVREINLISQDSTWYGRDLGDPEGLSRLVRRLAKIDGDFWIRILYGHPAHVTPRLLATMASEPKICPYLDVPMQHAADGVLARMRRGTQRADLEELVRRARSAMPEVAIRSAFIVGFPGETEAEFEELLDFLAAARLERVGVFAYSRENGTAAGAMPDQVPARVRRARRDAAMELQQKIAAEIHASWVGRATRVLVEGAAEGGGMRAAGRTPWDAPEIDGMILLEDDGLESGAFVDAEITGSGVYDVAGRVIAGHDAAGCGVADTAGMRR